MNEYLTICLENEEYDDLGQRLLLSLISVVDGMHIYSIPFFLYLLQVFSDIDHQLHL